MNIQITKDFRNSILSFIFISINGSKIFQFMKLSTNQTYIQIFSCPLCFVDQLCLSNYVLALYSVFSSLFFFIYYPNSTSFNATKDQVLPLDVGGSTNMRRYRSEFFSVAEGELVKIGGCSLLICLVPVIFISCFVHRGKYHHSRKGIDLRSALLTFSP